MTHTCGRPYHPKTQSKIEHWHRSLRNQILLENYYLLGELEQRIANFVEYYNVHRYHESLDNVTPEDDYLGQASAIITRRQTIKRQTPNTEDASIKML